MNELKQKVIKTIEENRARLLETADFLLKNPELGYCEYKTSAFVRSELEKLGLTVKTDLAITGLRADIASGKPGPRIAIMGELDALPVPSHPFADPATGAAHACGHYAQLLMMLAAAQALVPVIGELSGSIAFLAVPAEEFQEVLDDIDMVLLIHAGHDTFAPESFNGFCMKQIIFKGKAAHGGLSPWLGVNAASMARQALNMIDSQRDTFKDVDSVRIHGVISDGGKAVNVVPARAELELQIRAKTPDAVQEACALVDRCVKAAAMAFGGSVEINNLGGYMPYQSCAKLNAVHADNLQELCGGVLTNFGHRGSSTDMGDVSMLMPALHAYSGGFSGSPHAKDFVAVDPEKAYIQGAKLLAMDAITLLSNDAAAAREIASLPKMMDKQTYLNYKNNMTTCEEFNYDQA